MSVTNAKIIDRIYPLPVQRLLRISMVLAFVVFIVEMALIYSEPSLGLRLLWFATIPLAPMILLVAPNAWVSICPISTVQTFSHRFGQNPHRRLSPRITAKLQAFGWVLMIAGIPTRHLFFNSVGWATFWTALAILAVVLAAGLLFRSLSGWCVGACPIRPIEVLYGQFALDKNRPEKCTDCSACIPSCQRLVPENSHSELHRSSLTANIAMGFPGFVAAYFLLDLLNVCDVEHAFFAGTGAQGSDLLRLAGAVYGWMAAGFVVSWAAFFVLRRRLKERTLFRAIALSAFTAYYLGVAPEIREAWSLPFWSIPAMLIPPAVAMAWALWPSKLTDRTSRTPA
ncbi:MAG: 4Fe-4S dicluster domain-containing protein [Acidobacteria bacterium]|nr:4Fe-4S dicluster domain-containing protein [Acidobacteriota bacterium]